jgi:hypothetical protein
MLGVVEFEYSDETEGEGIVQVEEKKQASEMVG